VEFDFSLGGLGFIILNVLIVTPVIFFCLRSRQLKKEGTTSASAQMSEGFRNETSGKMSDGDNVSLTDTEKEVSHE